MNLEWVLIRGSGLVAFGLLAGSVIWGLLVTTKVLGRAAKAKAVTWFHESMGIASVLATVVHMVVLSMHEYIEFRWEDILIPGRSEWEPLAVAFGILAFYGSAIISVSFYVKRFIGQQAWRAIHFGSLGVFVAALLHGITAGTDTQEPWITAMYSATAALVVLLVAVRIAQEMTPESPRRAPRAEGSAERREAARVERAPSRTQPTSDLAGRLAALEQRRGASDPTVYVPRRSQGVVRTASPAESAPEA